MKNLNKLLPNKKTKISIESIIKRWPINSKFETRVEKSAPLSLHQVYVIFNTKTNEYYAGVSHDIERRLQAHKAGRVTSTKGPHKKHWKIVWASSLMFRHRAYILEAYFIRLVSSGNFAKLQFSNLYHA